MIRYVNERIVFMLPKSLKKDFDKACEAQGTFKTYVLNKLIGDWVKGQKTNKGKRL